MGILLIGIVAALFFRNEPFIDKSVPSVRRERELNNRLRERDVAVYLTDHAEPDASDQEETFEPQWTLRDVLQQIDERNRTKPSPIGKPTASVEADISELSPFARSAARSLQARSKSESSGPGVTSSSRVTADSQKPKSDILRSDGSAESQFVPAAPNPPESLPTSGTSATDSREDELSGIPDEFDEYIIRYGDTLSGIAQRTLGSQSRYREIFNANRDRIISPDRLDVGKPLRIPRSK